MLTPYICNHTGMLDDRNTDNTWCSQMGQGSIHPVNNLRLSQNYKKASYTKLKLEKTLSPSPY